MNILEQFLLAVTYLNLGGNRWNILGVMWLASLMLIYHSRLAGHFKNGFMPKPTHNPKSKLWQIALFIFTFMAVFFVQMCMDDLITTPLNLAFGSWSLLAPHLGEFTFMKLLNFKIDVYLLMLVYWVVFSFMGLWRFYQFSRWSMVWLGATIILQVVLGSSHIWYFLSLSGYDRLFTFWVSYPWFRIFTGLFAVSILKKPEAKT